ncbi:MAG: PLP-dependent transferase [bacterium]|nr:PLP-dependent transferase [bacterium]
MRNLLTDPLWRPEDLGTPIPPTPYGVSVCLPTWKSIIGYEEKDPAVINKLQSGYPRFFINPIVSKLIEKIEKELARTEERALVFPRRIHAERCAQFIKKYRPSTGADTDPIDQSKTRVIEYGPEKLGVTFFSKDDYSTARLYWRFCGEILSIRQAESALHGKSLERDVIENGKKAAETIKERLAEVTGQDADDVFLFPSGVAAIYAVHRTISAILPGLKTAQLDFPYVDTLKIQEYFGAGVHFLPFVTDDDYDNFRKIIKAESLAGIFSEIPSNPLLKSIDLRRIAAIAVEEKRKIPIIIDDTAATSVNIDVFRIADVAVTSLTKAFSGTGDVLAGSVILKRNSEFYPAFKKFLDEYNDNELYLLDAIILEEHSRNFAERVRTQSKNGDSLNTFLSGHPKVSHVYHSSNDSRGVYDYFRKPGGGNCSLLSFVLKDGSKTPRLYDSLEFCKGPSLGTNYTLICPYTMIAHYDELPFAEKCGVDRNLIRVSCGTEPEAVIIERMKRALDQL